MIINTPKRSIQKQSENKVKTPTSSIQEVKLTEKKEEKPAIKRTTRKRVTYLDNNED